MFEIEIEVFGDEAGYTAGIVPELVSGAFTELGLVIVHSASGA